MTYIALIKAKDKDMLGNSDLNKVLLLEVYGVIREIFWALIDTEYDEKYYELIEGVLQKTVRPKLDQLEKYMSDKTYVAGDYATINDFFMYEMLLRAA